MIDIVLNLLQQVETPPSVELPEFSSDLFKLLGVALSTLSTGFITWSVFKSNHEIKREEQKIKLAQFENTKLNEKWEKVKSEVSLLRNAIEEIDDIADALLAVSSFVNDENASDLKRAIDAYRGAGNRIKEIILGLRRK